MSNHPSDLVGSWAGDRLGVVAPEEAKAFKDISEGVRFVLSEAGWGAYREERGVVVRRGFSWPKDERGEEGGWLRLGEDAPWGSSVGWEG